jgi:hypothetical protein
MRRGGFVRAISFSGSRDRRPLQWAGVVRPVGILGGFPSRLGPFIPRRIPRISLNTLLQLSLSLRGVWLCSRDFVVSPPARVIRAWSPHASRQPGRDRRRVPQVAAAIGPILHGDVRTPSTLHDRPPSAWAHTASARAYTAPGPDDAHPEKNRVPSGRIPRDLATLPVAHPERARPRTSGFLACPVSWAGARSGQPRGPRHCRRRVSTSPTPHGLAPGPSLRRPPPSPAR